MKTFAVNSAPKIRWSIKPKSNASFKKNYSVDDMISAYNRGREDQNEENQQVLNEKFISNLESAQLRVQEFCDGLNITCKFARLRFVSISSFEAIVVFDESSFVSTKFRDVYKSAREFRTSVNSDTFKLSFIFMPFSDSLDEESLFLDGYVLKYEPKE